MRLLIRLAHVARWLLLGLSGWRTRGVRVIVSDATGAVLLIRHSYGARGWMLPGGGIARDEEPVAAAVREVREETGCRLTDAEPLGFYANGNDTVHLFRGRTADAPVPDGWEVVEARFWPHDALPADVSRATLRRLAEVRDGSVRARW